MSQEKKSKKGRTCGYCKKKKKVRIKVRTQMTCQSSLSEELTPTCNDVKVNE